MKIGDVQTTIYNLYENKGLNDISFTNDQAKGELHIIINALEVGKTESVKFIIHTEIGQYDANGQFIITATGRIRRLLRQRALQAYPDNYELTLLQAPLTTAYETLDDCLEVHSTNPDVCPG